MFSENRLCLPWGPSYTKVHTILLFVIDKRLVAEKWMLFVSCNNNIQGCLRESCVALNFTKQNVYHFIVSVIHGTPILDKCTLCLENMCSIIIVLWIMCACYSYRFYLVIQKWLFVKESAKCYLLGFFSLYILL